MYKRKFAIVMSRGNFISGEFTRNMVREWGGGGRGGGWYINDIMQILSIVMCFRLLVTHWKFDISRLLRHTLLPVLIDVK